MRIKFRERQGKTVLRINELKLPLDADEGALRRAAAKELRLAAEKIVTLRISKKSVDARKKENVHFIYSVDVTIDGDEQALLKRLKSGRVLAVVPYAYTMPERRRKSPFRPVVVGFGPAGMLAAVILADAGLRPIVLERGKDVDSRRRDVQQFWVEHTLNENSNVQFGEGGAGTFSDGKLTTGIKNPLCRKVLEELCDNGAPQEILYSSKPHIGTDLLGEVVKNFRRKVERLGGEVRLECKLTNIICANGAVHGVTYENAAGETVDLETDAVILAIGHSARDTAEMLYGKGVNMMQKPFSVGARIEHPQSLINRVQYGGFAGHPALGAADYKLACHPPHGRGLYTFCMCPGGTVVAAASEQGGVVVNGMSEMARDGENANAALLVGVDPEQFPDEHPLSGFRLQREIEQAAFCLGGGDYRAPAQLVGDFLQGVPSTRLGSVNPSCPTGVTLCDIARCLPEAVVHTMRDGIQKMDQKLRGFAMADAVLTAPETRSSSPVRMLRDETLMSNIEGIYPCGEGAGYAGGIVSAAVDGIRCAHAVLEF